MSEAGLVSLVHERLRQRYDIDRWHWRDDTPALDICVGAILVQHTNWGNVEKALASLRAAAAMTLEALAGLSEDELAQLVRSAGTPLTKARRLQTFARFVLDAGGFESLFRPREKELRPRLLALPGIGPETADAILLYAGNVPAIVHDAYTARLYRRLGTGPASNRYSDWQAWLDERLPHETNYRRRDHAAIVVHCKETCRARPRCAVCPLLDVCAFGQSQLSG
jgi:endonuclease-3 related protein